MSQFSEYNYTDKRAIFKAKTTIYIYSEEIDENKLDKINFEVLTTLLFEMKNIRISSNTT